jgi:cation transport ATPase
MDFNENPGYLYYKAWAQKADGTWFVTTSTGSEESKKMLLLFLGLLPLVLLGMGYGFKKSWILWLSIPFWFILGVYIGFFQDWFSNPTAQHSLILISIAASVAIGLAALRMQIAPLSNSATNMDGDDELDDDDNDFLREAKQYEKNSIIYKTKLKPRR